MNTPAEANSLWCPLARMPEKVPVMVVGGPGEPPNPSAVAVTVGFGNVPGQARCVSSACAMWRWTPSGNTTREMHVKELPHGNKQVVYEDVPLAPTHGYCGLAGRPEVLP